jgi:beta-lactamase class A
LVCKTRLDRLNDESFSKSSEIIAGSCICAGRLGVFALNTANGKQLSYRADEYFPMCSTFKVILAAAILKRSTQIDGLMQQRIKYQQSDLVTYSPITKQHLEDGMTVSALCAAAIQYSDHTASNLLMQILGGSVAVTMFAKSIGDRQFQLVGVASRKRESLGNCS